MFPEFEMYQSFCHGTTSGYDMYISIDEYAEFNE